MILKVLKCSLKPPEQLGGVKSFFDLTKCELKMLKREFFWDFFHVFDSVAQNFYLNRTKTYINARHNKNREEKALTVSWSTQLFQIFLRKLEFKI